MTVWFLLAGAIALLIAYAGGRLPRLPLSTSIVYIGVGYALGPGVFGLLDVTPQSQSRSFEAITQVVIIISIFSSALKLRIPLFDTRWLDPLRLAFLSMAIGIAALTATAHYLFGLSLASALLLAAILAPTDPVLASDVQVERPFEFSRLRFSLSGEAGMNDGTALPFVTLALALLGVHPIESSFAWWFVQPSYGECLAVSVCASYCTSS